jgi:hypothetical protein
MATFADLLDEVGTQNEFQTKLDQAKDAYRKQYGKDMPITSGLRTREQQEKLFNERASNPNLVAKPGTSKHETNEAADIPASVPESFLNQFGIHRPLGKKDPVHAVLMPQKEQQAKTEEPTTFGSWLDTLPTEKAQPEAGKVKQVSEKKFGMGERALQSRASLADTIIGGIQALPGTALAEVGYAGVRAGEGLGLVKPGTAERGRAEVYKQFVEPYTKPVGQALGVTETPAYKNEASRQIMEFVGQNLDKGADWISKQTGLPKADIENLMATAGVALPKVMAKPLAAVGEEAKLAGAALKQGVEAVTPKFTKQEPTLRPGMASVGAAATPTEATVQQALSVVTPELKSELQNIPVNKVNLPTLQRHIEADTLPVPVRLTEGQATGDVVKLSKEQNRRGQDPALAQRFNEQNGQLVENLNAFKDKTAPDVYGSRTMDHGQGLIDSYKTLDNTLKTDIDGKYQALRDAAGGDFPVDAKALLGNVEASLKKQLLSNDAPVSQMKELQRLSSENAMTFEDFLSLRRNLGQVARTSADGNVRTAASIMVKELEKLPLQAGAKELKPLADAARSAAKNRFQMLERDPAYRAAIDDVVPAEKFVEKFVINGHNKNVQTMINHLDPESRQHMAAGTINYLRDRAGIIDDQGNFSQAGYNKALKFLDDANKLPIIFDGETATGLKTLGNVARYTQAQPRGAFVNNSNTLVGALAERGKALVGKAAETGLNTAVPGLQLGTTVSEMRTRRAAAKETQKALKPGAGIKND